MDEKDIESDGAHLGELLLEVIELREQLLLGLRAKFVSLDLLSDCGLLVSMARWHRCVQYKHPLVTSPSRSNSNRRTVRATTNISRTH
jgi:hypothetical protein